MGEFEEKFEVISDMRGMGPMLAIELVKDRKTKKPNPEAASKAMKTSLSSGLITLKVGLYNNTVRLHPPRTIEEELLEKGLAILEDAFKKA